MGRRALSDEWFIGKFTDLVHPVVAHAVKRAETAEAEVERLKSRQNALLADLTAYLGRRPRKLPVESRIRVRLAELHVLGRR